LGLVPGTPSLVVPPELALAVFVAPVLLDAAYDTSPRDLLDNWLPIASLVIFAVGATTAAVAVVARYLFPEMPWAVAIALGAVVAPPDAVAATSVMRPLRPPQRLLTILEGESLLNDAVALLIYRVAVGAAVSSSFSFGSLLPTFLLSVIGSLVVGFACAWVVQRLTLRITHVPTAIIVQFVIAFSVWILAEKLGLSGVLTTVTFAISIARWSPRTTPARIRVPSYAVWDAMIFTLNLLAFIFIGLQIRPILGRLPQSELGIYLGFAVATLATVIGVRILWHMTFNALIRWRDRRFGFHPPRPMLRPTVGSGLVISWAGMRGIVTLAAALALPIDFPFRGLLVLTAFSVVLGTLVIQGLTLKPLLRRLKLADGDPVAAELQQARESALRAAVAALGSLEVPEAKVAKHQLNARLGAAAPDERNLQIERSRHLLTSAISAARDRIFQMRANDEIGDDAFHAVEADLDWLEMIASERD